MFEENPEAGAGAGTFQVTRLRHRKDQLVSRHAHGYVVQTMADLGVAGLVASGAALLLWLAAIARATGFAIRGRERDYDAERVALIALVLCAVAFGAQSAIDWTWAVPAPSLMAVVAGAFVAGRALRRRAAETAAAPAGAQGPLRLLRSAAPPARSSPARRWPRRWRARGPPGSRSAPTRSRRRRSS